MASDERPPYRHRPGTNLLRYGAETHVERSTLEELRRASQYLGWDGAKATRRAGGDRDHPIVGPRVLGWEVDDADSCFFMGRRFIASDTPGSSMVWFREDVDRILKSVAEARRHADIVLFALHDQSMTKSDAMQALAHEVIDAGADIYMNTVGIHGGIELYKTKVILYGQPSLWFQNEQIRHVPSSAMALLDLPDDAASSQFLDTRARAFSASEALAPKWTAPSAGFGVGTAVHHVVFDDRATLREIQVHPLEVVTSPRQRSGLPLAPEPGGDIERQVLALAGDKAARYGTTLVVESGMGIIRPG